jgi:hypothetical protein
MSAPGRSEALIPQRAARRDNPTSAPGRSTARLAGRAGCAGTAARRCCCEFPASPEALIPQRAARRTVR